MHHRKSEMIFKGQCTEQNNYVTKYFVHLLFIIILFNAYSSTGINVVVENIIWCSIMFICIII